jgi:hypothetical protein
MLDTTAHDQAEPLGWMVMYRDIASQLRAWFDYPLPENVAQSWLPPVRKTHPEAFLVALYPADAPLPPASDEEGKPADEVAAYRKGRIDGAQAVERYAESIGWYEAGGVWAEAIELAKGEHVSQKPATDPWPEAPLTTAQEPDQQPDDPAARYCQCGAALVNGLCPDTAEGRKDQAAGPGSATTTPQES